MKLTKGYLNKYLVIHLADKLINTTNKKENQIIVKNIEKKNTDKHLEMDDLNGLAIQPNDQSINLLDTIKLILDFNENKLKDLV